MNTGKTVFAQIMDYLPLHEFNKCVKRYSGNYRTKSFSCRNQFFVMAFAQLTYRESLRDIETCLRSLQSKLYHMGLHCKISRSTLAEANEKRNWRIYSDFAYHLISIAKKLYANEQFELDMQETVYALDSTTITLCLSLFPWSTYRYGHGGVKLHTLLDLRSKLPVFALVTNAKVCDHDILDDILFEPGAFYIIDRGYIDLSRLYSLHRDSAFFVTRSKTHLSYKRLYSHPVDKTTGLCCDQTIRFTGNISAKNYPAKLRRIKYFCTEKEKYFVFLTNNFKLPAIIIAKLYKCRWQIELFFKWIKQHLRIKAFYGTSINAVQTQIWIAISVYVIIAIIKKHLKTDLSLYTILQIFSISIFEKMPIKQLLADDKNNLTIPPFSNQLLLFDL